MSSPVVKKISLKSIWNQEFSTAAQSFKARRLPGKAAFIFDEILTKVGEEQKKVSKCINEIRKSFSPEYKDGEDYSELFESLPKEEREEINAEINDLLELEISFDLPQLIATPDDISTLEAQHLKAFLDYAPSDKIKVTSTLDGYSPRRKGKQNENNESITKGD